MKRGGRRVGEAGDDEAYTGQEKLSSAQRLVHRLFPATKPILIFKYGLPVCQVAQ